MLRPVMGMSTTEPTATAVDHTSSTGLIRAFEVFSILSFLVMEAWFAWELWPHTETSPWVIGIALFSGYIFADWISGFVHWLADTWGHPEMPVIGRALIGPFREHHVDPKGITRHGFIETNGNNCFMTLPVGLVVLQLDLDADWKIFTVAFWAATFLWTLFTNQFHKWAHLDAPGPIISALQKSRLILSVEHHDIHHRAPFDTHYCITTGWCNRIMAVTRFWRALEWLVTRTTGVRPRVDDLERVGVKTG